MILSVASGKGGTGKTMLTASFAALTKNKVMVDCDVDAADLHLLLKPEIKEKQEFRSGLTARIDKDICQECSECISVCRFMGKDQISMKYVYGPVPSRRLPEELWAKQFGDDPIWGNYSDDS